MSEIGEREDRRFAERLRQAYASTPVSGPEGRARVAARAQAAARARRSWRSLSAWIEPRTFSIRPVAAFAAAVALVAAGALLAPRLGGSSRTGPGRGTHPAPPPPGGAHGVQFVLVTFSASSVSLVGDFNGWDAVATPMRRGSESGVWTATVPLAPGCHSYAFVVDGDQWVADPQAPQAPADDYDMRRSVVVVGENGT